MQYSVKSLADQVYTQIESDILSGTYERGEQLTEMKLSELLGVSRTPVREAMIRLEQEHLIEIKGKTACIVGLTRQDLEDIFEIRIRLEGLATARAALNADQTDLKELENAVDVGEFYISRANHEGIREMDSRFHQLIYQTCGSLPIRYTLEPLHRRVTRYRQVSVTDEQRAVLSLKEHRAIFEAVSAHDAEKAEQLAIAHVVHARDHILNQD